MLEIDYAIVRGVSSFETASLFASLVDGEEVTIVAFFNREVRKLEEWRLERIDKKAAESKRELYGNSKRMRDERELKFQ